MQLSVLSIILSCLKPVQGTSVSRDSQEIIGLQNTGRDIKDHPVSTFLHGQGHLPPDKPAQAPIQSGLERQASTTLWADCSSASTTSLSLEMSGLI